MSTYPVEKKITGKKNPTITLPNFHKRDFFDLLDGFFFSQKKISQLKIKIKSSTVIQQYFYQLTALKKKKSKKIWLPEEKHIIPLPYLHKRDFFYLPDNLFSKKKIPRVLIKKEALQ